MIDTTKYLETLVQSGVEFYTGVPDSLLKEFCACVSNTSKPGSHVIAANEGGALALAIGHHIGTGKTPLVYMQNSGLGNSVNPLLSLASTEVYSIPLLLMIGWRGEPNIKDEPQHVHQGRVMMDMLEAMGVPTFILSNEQDTATRQTIDAINHAENITGPVAIIVKKGSFSPYEVPALSSNLVMTREQALTEYSARIETDAVVIATTGMASRELYEYRSSNSLGHERDFLTVGGMGHASQIATGVALSQPKRQIYCFDGDGAAIMHMGSLGITGMSGLSNLVHIVFNNGVHGSVGGQPTIGFDINFCQIALACGYRTATRVKTLNEISESLIPNTGKSGPRFIEVQTRHENRANIGRPKSSPVENKIELMKHIGSKL